MKINLSGQKIGRLHIKQLSTYRKKNRNDLYWECQCDCGKKIIRTTYSLRDKHKNKSCGCYTSELLSSKFNNLINKKFGRLTVIQKLKKRSRKGTITWKCRCKCGKYLNVISESLVSGNTKSCGCLQKEAVKKLVKNIVGRVFGDLIVLKRQGSNKFRAATWKCKCKCGNIGIFSSGSLTSGHSSSCGKCLWSGERYFIDKLNKYFKGRLEFKHKFSPDYLGKQHHDGYDTKHKIAIEYNGEQHYKPIKFYGGIKAYHSIKLLDKKKKIKCKKANIHLFEFRPKKDNINKFINILERHLTKYKI